MVAALELLVLLGGNSSKRTSPSSHLQGRGVPPAPRGRVQAAGLSVPSHQEPAITLIVAICSLGFYKLPTKYLGMPSVSAVADVPVCKLFMNQCLNSQGSLLSINYLSPSSDSLGTALFYFQATAHSLALVVRHGGHHSDPKRWSGVSQAACLGSQGSALPPVFWPYHCCVGSQRQVLGYPVCLCLQPLSNQADARNQGALAAEALNAPRRR